MGEILELQAGSGNVGGAYGVCVGGAIKQVELCCSRHLATKDSAVVVRATAFPHFCFLADFDFLLPPAAAFLSPHWCSHDGGTAPPSPNSPRRQAPGAPFYFSTPSPPLSPFQNKFRRYLPFAPPPFCSLVPFKKRRNSPHLPPDISVSPCSPARPNQRIYIHQSPFLQPLRPSPSAEPLAHRGTPFLASHAVLSPDVRSTTRPTSLDRIHPRVVVDSSGGERLQGGEGGRGGRSGCARGGGWGSRDGA